MDPQEESSTSGSKRQRVNDEGLQRMIDTNMAMHYNNQLIIAQSMANRPINTIKAYSGKQDEWKQWCAEMKFSDGEIVSDPKLSYFLSDYVAKRGKKNKRNSDGTPCALGRESILAYVKSVVDLYNQQKALGLNQHPVARGPLVRTYLDMLDKEKVKEKRKNFDDRGKNTLNDGYTKEELLKVSQHFLTNKNDSTGARDRLCFLISHSMHCRSQTALGMQFADLFAITFDNQGLSQCLSLVATINFGKTNQHGKIEYGSSVRHKEVELCSVGALALYLFSRFHFDNEEFPDFSERKNWYTTVVFPGKNRFTPLTYRAQHKIYVEVFKKVGIHTSKVTHANRKSALNMIAQENVPGDQQRMVGRWGTDRMVGCYISSLPIDAMKSLAGFSSHSNNYFLPRAAITPPDELAVQVFPDIEFWMAKFLNGDDVQEDIAGPNFLNLLQQLRIVFLQDSVLLKKKFPHYYLWTCQIFNTNEYKEFEERLLASLQESEQMFSANYAVQIAMPELVASLESGFELLKNLMLANQASNMAQYERLVSCFTGFFAMGNAFFNASGATTATNAQQPASSQAAAFQPFEQLLNSNQGVSSSQVSLSTTNNGPPAYVMNRNIVSITDLWREYSVGLNGGPAVKELEEKYGTTWRKDRKESRFFSRRKEMYEYIKRTAANDRLSPEEAARRLEERRVQLSVSIDKLRQKLKEESAN